MILEARFLVILWCMNLFEQHYGEPCHKLCPPGELDSGSGLDQFCRKLVYLNDPCDSGPQSARVCEEAFSTCQNGFCKCLPGFTEFDEHCKPDKVICPGSVASRSTNPPCSITIDRCKSVACALGHNSYSDELCRPDRVVDPPDEETTRGPLGFPGQAERKKGVDLTLTSRLDDDFGCLPKNFSPLKKSKKNKGSRSRNRRHTEEYSDRGCADDQFCYTFAAYRFSDCKVRAYGHCCDHACPVGTPHPNASCALDATVKCEEQDGYFCSRSYLSESVANTVGRDMDSHFLATCCPRHCPADMIALNDGHCISKVQAGQSCWRDEQCPFSLSCVRGVCSCTDSDRLIVVDRETGARCIRNSDQIPLPLGSRCVEEVDVCAEDNSLCKFEDGDTRCVCACGYRRELLTCVKEDVRCPDDTSTECSEWARQGECQANPDWMMANCARSCNAC